MTSNVPKLLKTLPPARSLSINYTGANDSSPMMLCLSPIVNVLHGELYIQCSINLVGVDTISYLSITSSILHTTSLIVVDRPGNSTILHFPLPSSIRHARNILSQWFEPSPFGLPRYCHYKSRPRLKFSFVPQTFTTTTSPIYIPYPSCPPKNARYVLHSIPHPHSANLSSQSDAFVSDVSTTYAARSVESSHAPLISYQTADDDSNPIEVCFALSIYHSCSSHLSQRTHVLSNVRGPRYVLSRLNPIPILMPHAYQNAKAKVSTVW